MPPWVGSRVCPLCGFQVRMTLRKRDFGREFLLDCQRCGGFSVTTQSAEEILALSNHKKALLFDWLHTTREPESGGPILLSSGAGKVPDGAVKIGDVLDLGASDQIAPDKHLALRNLAHLSARPSTQVTVEDNLGAVLGCGSAEELSLVLRALTAEGKVSGFEAQILPTRVSLSLSGWESVQQEHQAQPKPSELPAMEQQMSEVPASTQVFVVHGRNSQARDSMFAFLRSLGLTPLEWSHATKLTGKGSPYIGEVLDRAFEYARAVVVLLTGDDEARLRSEFLNEHDDDTERQLTAQARPNVLFEAGMAFGRNPDLTILVQLGHKRAFSDIAGRHVVRLDNTSERRNELAERLRAAGCNVDTSGSDWLKVADFNLPPAPARPASPAPVGISGDALEILKCLGENSSCQFTATQLAGMLEITHLRTVHSLGELLDRGLVEHRNSMLGEEEWVLSRRGVSFLVDNELD